MFDKTAKHWGLAPLPAIEIHATEPIFRLSSFQGQRILSTDREMVAYGLVLMDLGVGIDAVEVPLDILKRWDGDVELFVQLDQSIRLVAGIRCVQGADEARFNIAQALDTQMMRREGRNHLRSAVFKPIWDRAYAAGVEHLAATEPTAVV